MCIISPTFFNGDVETDWNWKIKNSGGKKLGMNKGQVDRVKDYLSKSFINFLTGDLVS